MWQLARRRLAPSGHSSSEPRPSPRSLGCPDLPSVVLDPIDCFQGEKDLMPSLFDPITLGDSTAKSHRHGPPHAQPLEWTRSRTQRAHAPILRATRFGWHDHQRSNLGHTGWRRLSTHPRHLVGRTNRRLATSSMASTRPADASCYNCSTWDVFPTRRTTVVHHLLHQARSRPKAP